MKLIVFGATGRTGKFLVDYALQAGHEVTALVRHKSKMNLTGDKLTLIEGDVYDRDLVSRAIKGHDVVLSALGTNQVNDEKAVNLMSDAMRIFIDAMHRYGVKRVLAVGGLGALQLNETLQIIDKPDYPAAYKLVGIGHNKVYQVLRPTDLDWTFVCCPSIPDGPRTGKYVVKKDYLPEGTGEILTGDIADFMLKEMVANNFVRSRVGITNIA